MQNIKVIIVEDEIIVAKDISYTLEEIGCTVLGIMMEGEKVIPFLEKELPDIILMDIMLQGTLNGVEVVQRINKMYDIPVIYLTANTDDHSFELAKSTQPFAFIEKPFKKKTLIRTLELLIERIAKERSTSARESFLLNDRIFLREGNKMVKVHLEDILFIEAERAYCRVKTEQKNFLLTSSLNNLAPKLPPSYFMRIHRSYIVNLQKIDSIEDNFVKIKQENIPVSRSYWKAFLNRVNVI